MEIEYEKLRTKLYNTEYRRLARIEKKYNGDRVKIREELGFEMPVRSKRKRTQSDSTASSAIDADDNKDINAHKEGTITLTILGEVNSTCGTSSAGQDVAIVSVTGTMDASSPKETSSTNLRSTNADVAIVSVTGTMHASSPKETSSTNLTCTNATKHHSETTQQSSAEKVSSGAVSNSDSVTELSLLNSPKVASTENVVSNPSMFFGDDKGSHKVSSQSRTLGNDTI